MNALERNEYASIPHPAYGPDVATRVFFLSLKLKCQFWSFEVLKGVEELVNEKDPDPDLLR